MASILNKLIKQQLIYPPTFLEDNVNYEVIMGSYAYGCNDPEKSDLDIYGFCMPPLKYIFPHTAGEIFGFDKQTERFEQFQSHHIVSDNKEYDLTCFSIIKFFRLCADCVPNTLDSLFVPFNCILFQTQLGQHVRENRKIFLSKKAFHSYKGYSFAQFSKLKNKTTSSNPRRQANIDQYKMDLKHGYHLVRLLCQLEQMLLEGDMDLQRNKEMLKSIRKGDWSFEDLEKWFSEKERLLERLNLESTAIPDKIPEELIKKLLIECLEMHYGSLDNLIKLEKNPHKLYKIIKDIRKLTESV